MQHSKSNLHQQQNINIQTHESKRWEAAIQSLIPNEKNKDIKQVRKNRNYSRSQQRCI